MKPFPSPRSLVLFLGLGAFSCRPLQGLAVDGGRPSVDGGHPSVTGLSHVEHFGFVGVDCFVDDPLDATDATDYIDEVAGFTNLVHFCLSGDLAVDRARLERLKGKKLKALLHTQFLFKDIPDTTARNGSHRTALEPAYRDIWRSLLETHRAILSPDVVAAIYVVDEPSWNGLSNADLATVSRMIEESLPELPLLVVEAYPAIDTVDFPPSIDWIGFDHFATRHPLTNADWQREWATLEAKRSPRQKLVLVFDASLGPEHVSAGLRETELVEIAKEYVELARREPEVVALIGYAWPGGIGGPEVKGARNLPEDYRLYVGAVGRNIVGAR